MANSFQMALRGGIMIVTMVAIPLLAIFGKQIPELLEGIYRGNTKTEQWQSRPTQPVATTTPPGSPAPAVQNPHPGLSEAPAFQAGTAGSLNPGNNLSPKFEPPALPNNAFTSAQPLPVNPPSQVSRNSPLGQTLPPSTLRDQAVSPVVNHATTSPTDLTSTAFKQGQQRLRELGASYFKLETTGEATERYRAVCQIAPVGNMPVQTFTSIHVEPLTALNDVITQIERSRGGRGMDQQAQRGMYR